MKYWNVLVCFLLVTVTESAGKEIVNSCRKLCCSGTANKTRLRVHFEKENTTTNCTKDCLQPKGQDSNITLRELCSKPKPNRTNNFVVTSKSLYMQIDCQEMFDKANNDFVGLVKGIDVYFKDIQGYWYINITWHSLNDPKIANKWSHYAILWNSNMHNNCYLVSKNQTFLVINVTAHGWEYPQPIYLNVSTFPLMNNIGYRHEIEARPPLGKMVMIPATMPSKVSTGVLVAIIVGSCVGLFLFIMLIIAWKLNLRIHTVGDSWHGYIDALKWFKALQPEKQENFEYDASILYSSHDEQWVTEELVPLLETENNFKCFIHFRDFDLGAEIHENMANAAYKCRKNIAVVSKNFLRSNYCKDELNMALERVQRCGDYSLIVVNLDGVPIEKLPKALRIRTFVNLTSSQEQKTWKSRLVRQISAEDQSHLNNQWKNVHINEVLQVTSEGCEVISNTNEVNRSDIESV